VVSDRVYTLCEFNEAPDKSTAACVAQTESTVTFSLLLSGASFFQEQQLLYCGFLLGLSLRAAALLLFLLLRARASVGRLGLLQRRRRDDARRRDERLAILGVELHEERLPDLDELEWVERVSAGSCI
jgi:hypothetical protein